MNKRLQPTKPTESELSILAILWAKGPCKVRDVFDEMSLTREVGYTTVLKLMQIMDEKGLVERDDSRRAHIYRAKQLPESSQHKMVDDLVDRVFGGSAQQLVMHALSTRKSTTEELSQIRSLIEELERKANP